MKKQNPKICKVCTNQKSPQYVNMPCAMLLRSDQSSSEISESP